MALHRNLLGSKLSGVLSRTSYGKYLRISSGSRAQTKNRCRDYQEDDIECYVSGLQPSDSLAGVTWAFGPGWYVARRWRFLSVGWSERCGFPIAKSKSRFAVEAKGKSGFPSGMTNKGLTSGE
jgi:hypothetical protein